MGFKKNKHNNFCANIVFKIQHRTRDYPLGLDVFYQPKLSFDLISDIIGIHNKILFVHETIGIILPLQDSNVDSKIYLIYMKI